MGLSKLPHSRRNNVFQSAALLLLLCVASEPSVAQVGVGAGVSAGGSDGISAGLEPPLAAQVGLAPVGGRASAALMA
jgi:hypothetical protein